MTAPPHHPAAENVEARRRWIGTLAKARPAELDEAWSGVAARPGYRFLRKPEIGLVMMRGRMGGDGRPFNLGEITVTRCSVRLDGGQVGHATVAGRSTRHAELAAVFDAMMQDDGRGAEIESSVIAPLARRQLERRDEVARKTAATRVEFFTLARGSD
jgi:alpha-D-ribose 1-methylphosphonate 5-triphosphate synthase subunit PhnG